MFRRSRIPEEGAMRGLAQSLRCGVLSACGCHNALKLESSNVDAGFCSSKSLRRHHQHFKLPAIPVVGNLKIKLQAGFKMKILRNRLLGTALVAAGSLYAMHPAHALNGPTAIDIDGGPLGQLELSGGMSGYFYGQTGTSNKGNSGGSLLGDRSSGANLAQALIELQKTSGILQFTIEVGPQAGSPYLGLKPSKASVTVYRASPIYLGYVTLAPKNSPVTISVGQLGSLEGYESGVSWNDANLYKSALFYVENGQNVGVSATYTHDKFSAQVTFGDGYDTRVFNFLQALATYQFNSNNALNVYYGGELGKTGLNAITYGQTPVGVYGPEFVNSQMFGAFYSYTQGNLNVVPEVQYVYANPDHALMIPNYTSNFGAAVFTDYTFGKSPYSLGGMAEYFTSNGSGNWFIAPHAEGVGIQLSPTWQYKDLYARLSVGYMHLLNRGFNTPGSPAPAYGNNGTGNNVVQGALEAGLLF
jgi:Putative beta-barrel porin-2, OmpL-like. bbp2